MAEKHVGKHRLGTPGLVHCVSYRQVSDALAEYRRTWFSALLVPAKHSLAWPPPSCPRSRTGTCLGPLGFAGTRLTAST